MSLARTRSDDATLRDIIDEQAETIRQLREQLVPTLVFPSRWRLTRKESQMLSFLLARSPQACSQDRIIDALYAIDPDDPPDKRIVDVFLCKLRAKIRSEHVAIETAWGEGYRLSIESAQRLHALCRAEAFSAVTIAAELTADGPIVSVDGDIASPVHLERAIAAMRSAAEKAWSTQPSSRRVW